VWYTIAHPTEDADMLWELVRDIGLIIFVFGGLVRFAVTRIFRRRMDVADTRRMNAIGDGMMLAGACLAVSAMFVDYLMSGESP